MREDDLRSGPATPMVTDGDLTGTNDLVNKLQISN